ncbi:MAG: hypothetical protein ABR970_17275 [Roseiarcus sp.]|jgi:hypothetical protein
MIARLVFSSVTAWFLVVAPAQACVVYCQSGLPRVVSADIVEIASQRAAQWPAAIPSKFTQSVKQAQPAQILQQQPPVFNQQQPQQISQQPQQQPQQFSQQPQQQPQQFSQQPQQQPQFFQQAQLPPQQTQQLSQQPQAQPASYQPQTVRCQTPQGACMIIGAPGTSCQCQDRRGNLYSGVTR